MTEISYIIGWSMPNLIGSGEKKNKVAISTICTSSYYLSLQKIVVFISSSLQTLSPMYA